MPAPLILLPGMMCDARLFAPQMAAMTDRTVICPALVGFETTGALADAVLADAPPRFALAGLSMGGIVAMEIMTRAPGRVSHLALLDTNHRAETPERTAARLPQMEAARQGRLRAVMRDEMKPNYLVDGPGKPAILDLCMDMAEDLGPDVFIAQSRALATRPDQTETLMRITVPTLVLCGAEDRLCSPALHGEMRDLIPDAALCVIDAAGHLPVLEQPDAVNAALTDWLGR
jgi:pimeloyl-ACP methyl ester carboxylesterase